MLNPEFVAELELAKEEMQDILVTADEAGQGMLFHKTMELLGKTVHFIGVQEEMRESLLIQVGELNPNDHRSRRFLNSDNASALLEEWRDEVVEQVQTLIIGRSQEDEIERRQQRQRIVQNQQEALRGFDPIFVDAVIGLLARNTHRGYGSKSHWGRYAIDGIKAIGADLVEKAIHDQMTRKHLGDLVLGRGLYESFRRAMNPTTGKYSNFLSPKAVDIAMGFKSKTSSMPAIARAVTEDCKARGYLNGIAPYVLEVLHFAVEEYDVLLAKKAAEAKDEDVSVEAEEPANA